MNMTDHAPFGANWDAFYRNYVLANVARTMRAEYMEEVTRQWEIAELEGM